MDVLSTEVLNEPDAASGQRGLFERVFDQHYARVHRIVSGLVGPDEADDAAQDVFLHLYHQRALLDEPAERLAGWLYRVAVNTSYNLLRARRRLQARQERAGLLDQADVHTRQADLNPVQRVTAHEEAQLVRAALAQLSETHRTVLLLRQAGLSYAQIAAAAGVRPGSVGTLLARAEAHLRTHYYRLAGETPPPEPSDEEQQHGTMS